MHSNIPITKSAQVLRITAWWTIAVWIAIATQQTYWFLHDFMPSHSAPAFAWRKLALFLVLATVGVTYSVTVLRNGRYSAVVGSALLSIFSVWAFSQPAVQIVTHWQSIDLGQTTIPTRLILAKWLSFCCLAPLWIFFTLSLRPAR
jgi:hypothetical protein